MDADELDDYRARHPLAAALPAFRELLGERASDDEHIFAVADAAGILLWVQGHASTLDRAGRMNFVEGAEWSESAAGTNALGTALAVEAELAIRTAAADERARREYADRRVPGRSAVALVSPGGRLLAGTPVGRECFAEAIGQAGHLMVQYAAQNIIPVTLELGGKSPNIFFRDVAAADDEFLDKAVEGLVLYAFNKGEVCTCPSRSAGTKAPRCSSAGSAPRSAASSPTGTTSSPRSLPGLHLLTGRPAGRQAWRGHRRATPRPLKPYAASRYDYAHPPKREGRDD